MLNRYQRTANMITIRNRLKSTRIEDQFKGKSITKRNSQWIWFDCTFACILSTQKKTKLFCFERQNNILFKICVPYQSTPDYSMHSNAHNKLFFYLRISLHHFAIGFLCHLPLSLATLSYITRIKEIISPFRKPISHGIGRITLRCLDLESRKICQIWPDYRLLNISMILLFKPSRHQFLWHFWGIYFHWGGLGIALPEYSASESHTLTHSKEWLSAERQSMKSGVHKTATEINGLNEKSYVDDQSTKCK